MSLSVIQNESTWINAMRIPFTLMVVLSHSIWVVSLGTEPMDYSSLGAMVYSSAQLIFLQLGHIAVGVFAILSAYFLFFKYSNGFSLKLYKTECKKRIYTLFIPYVLWNLIQWAFLLLKNTFALKVGFFPGFSEIEYSQVVPFSLKTILSPINFPLWYVRDVMWLCLFSPLIYYLIKYTRGWFLLIFGVLYLFVDVPIPLVKDYITLHFVLGAVLGFYRRSLFSPLNQTNAMQKSILLEGKQNVLESVAYVLSIIFLLLITFGNQLISFFYILSLGLPSVALASFFVAPRIFRNTATLSVCLRYSNMAFLIYSMHSVGIINLVRGFLLLTPLSQSPWGELIIVVVVFIVATAYCILGYRILSKLAPRLLNVLCGGRS